MNRASGRLFDNSEDEESGSEDDSHRFRIKPQFEGRAGQKLLDLQSRFGTDDRFRMDSRFLESDSEEEQEGKYVPAQTVLMSELGDPEKSSGVGETAPQDLEL